MSDGFCMQCGSSVRALVPAGDNRPRKVCTVCDHIHYENPKNVVGCLLEWQGKVLLCKRAIEPRYGYWTLPAGFMENGESTIEGAAREAFEEATARCDELRLFSVYNLPRISQVYLMFHGQLRDGFAEANEETLEVRLFDQSEIPWSELAFPVVVETLTRYYEMRHQRDRRVYSADIFSRPGSPLEIVRHPH
ncbi:NUDIX hydrolase [Granulosicoccus sp. 3-233]|uniref:NUDIX hydrolase n=1 Tax=Granulosicoccus sp. 3-233 TaxID=3417969 RepID=UPI003D343E7E